MQLFLPRLNIMIQLCLRFVRNEGFKVASDGFLNSDRYVLFNIVLDQLVVIRVVLVFLHETFYIFLCALLGFSKIFNFC